MPDVPPEGGGAGCEGAGAAAVGVVFWVVLAEPELPHPTSKSVEQSIAAESAPMRPNEADASIFITRPHETSRMLLLNRDGRAELRVVALKGFLSDNYWDQDSAAGNVESAIEMPYRDSESVCSIQNISRLW
jgi:hypothetical protein